MTAVASSRPELPKCKHQRVRACAAFSAGQARLAIASPFSRDINEPATVGTAWPAISDQNDELESTKKLPLLATGISGIQHWPATVRLRAFQPG